MMLAAALIGCTDQEETTLVSDTPVAVSLAFSLPDLPTVTNKTRMADNVVQVSSDYYRGLKDVRIIPFKIQGKVKKEDSPYVMDASRDEKGRVAGKPSELTPNSAFYYYPECSFWSGTASMLFYARGANTSEVDGVIIPATDKGHYGSTLSTGTSDIIPSLIQFSPEQIHSGASVDDKAKQLADYLTAIANTEGWASTNDSKLKALYLNMLHQDDEGNYGVIAGSSPNVKAFVEELYKEVEFRESDNVLADAIRTNISNGADVLVDNDGKVTKVTLKDHLSGYPANIGLPDGAAALKWDGSAFVPQTKTTVEATITSMDRFVFPAELCYYGNSTITTSRTEVAKSVYENETTWDGVLGYYTAGTVVNGKTKSAAMVSPVQYGVARLSVRLNMLKTTLKDKNNEEVSFSDTYYPLTAVIVGGQYPVGFDFRPETVQAWPTNETESTDFANKMFIVYDPQVKTKKIAGSSGTDTYDYYCLSSSMESGNTNTLVLQSYESKKVRVVLEFENNSNQKFMGHDGIVYPGTKFYLVGEVDPSSLSSTTSMYAENRNRVFTQDYTTTFMMSIESFANAYNVMPDLLAPRMEIGVKVENWETLPPTTLELQQ